MRKYDNTTNKITLNQKDKNVYNKIIKVKKGVYEQFYKISFLSYTNEEKEILKKQMYTVGLKKLTFFNISKRILNKLEKEETEIYNYLSKIL